MPRLGVYIVHLVTWIYTVENDKHCVQSVTDDEEALCIKSLTSKQK